MTNSTPAGKAQLPARKPARFSAFKKNEDGQTVIEFAMVVIPFLMILFGIMGLGLFFFTTFALENAVERAGRLVRTGQVAAENMSAADFKAKVCRLAPDFVDCDSNLNVYVQAFPDTSASLTPMDCLDGAGTGLNPGTAYDPSAPDQVMLVTACYKWELPAILPFIDLGNMGDTGYRLIQAVTTFRTEPFTTGGS